MEIETNKPQQLILELLRSEKELDLEEICLQGSLENGTAIGGILYLNSKELITSKKNNRHKWIVTKKGEDYEDLPELKLIKLYEQGVNKLEEASTYLGKDLFGKAINHLKKENYIEIKDGKYIICSGAIDKVSSQNEAFKKIKNNQSRLISQEKSLEEIALEKNGLIELKCIPDYNLKITPKGKDYLNSLNNKIKDLTPEIISSGEWKNKEFESYDVSIPSKNIKIGKLHPLTELTKEIKKIFLSMGFKEHQGPLVETSFWNFDTLLIPQDHPAREIQDTFYLSNPEYTKSLDNKKNIVKSIHEKMYQQKWAEKISSENVLRTHTTSVTARNLGSISQFPEKFFCIGRIFRNESQDLNHFIEFHQIEGVVLDYNLTLSSLIGYLEEFYSKFGIGNLKFKPTYNPYTEPSLEIFGIDPRTKKQIELGNTGMFRPEMHAIYGFDSEVTSVAWGLGLERLAGILYNTSVRPLVGDQTDIDSIRKTKKWLL